MARPTATTPAKKRTPKPTMTLGTRFVLSLLPWLQLPDDAPAEAVERALFHPLAILFNEPEGDIERDFTGEIRQRAGRLREVKALLTWAIRVAAGHPLEDRERRNELLRVRATVRINGEWMPGSLAIRLSFKADEVGKSLDNFPGGAAVLLTTAFVEDCAGAYVGACPRCGKVFEKRRWDQAFDRSTCQKEHTRK